MKVVMGDYDVPFNSNVNVGELLLNMHMETDQKTNDSDDEENNIKFIEDNGGKKRKRKRGKAI